jgi:hypothetical protein
VEERRELFIAVFSAVGVSGAAKEFLFSVVDCSRNREMAVHMQGQFGRRITVVIRIP